LATVISKQSLTWHDKRQGVAMADFKSLVNDPAFQSLLREDQADVRQAKRTPSVDSAELSVDAVSGCKGIEPFDPTPSR
jgi:hypothetical protein